MKKPKESKSLLIARGGIRTDREFCGLMSALIADLAEGAVEPDHANAIVNAGAKMLKCVELRLRYGTQAGEAKVLALQ